MSDMASDLEEAGKKIEPYKDIARKEVEDLCSVAKEIKEGLSNVMDEDRLFRIAVLGQMKAGKSSFLNALLFDGKGVLPAAAEPMTAALTVIRYAEKCRAEVNFYSKAEWDGLQKCAAEYDEIYREEERKVLEAQERKHPGAPVRQPPRLMIDSNIGDGTKSAYRLVSGIRDSGLNADTLVGTSKTLRETERPDELIAELQDYIGSNGRYTLLVSSVVLYYNDEKIRDLEIVDTPGLNDPVIERTRRTKDMLKTCDAAFYLSPTSSFLTDMDLRLLSQNLPADGVEEIVLVASRFEESLSVRGTNSRRSRGCMTEILRV